MVGLLVVRQAQLVFKQQILQVSRLDFLKPLFGKDLSRHAEVVERQVQLGAEAHPCIEAIANDEVELHDDDGNARCDDQVCKDAIE